MILQNLLKLLKGMSRRTLLLTLAMVISITGVTAGTMAWLLDSSNKVENTFTYGDVNVELEETDTGIDDDEDPNTNEYQMMPGKPITKDPKVTVKAGTEDCWVFVQLTESENFDDFLTYEMAVDADGNPIWTALTGYEGVYYCQLDRTEADVVMQVLKDDQVLVKPEVTKEMLNALDAEGGAGYPTLTLQAFAVQRDAEIEAIATPVAAWETMQAETGATTEAGV